MTLLLQDSAATVVLSLITQQRTCGWRKSVVSCNASAMTSTSISCGWVCLLLRFSSAAVVLLLTRVWKQTVLRPNRLRQKWFTFADRSLLMAASSIRIGCFHPNTVILFHFKLCGSGLITPQGQRINNTPLKSQLRATWGWLWASCLFPQKAKWSLYRKTSPNRRPSSCGKSRCHGHW